MIEIKKEKKKEKNKNLKYLKILIISFFLTFFWSNSFAASKADCSMIKNNTGAGWLKTALCKRGSDKLDKDGNFKKGTFNILKKFKKK